MLTISRIQINRNERSVVDTRSLLRRPLSDDSSSPIHQQQTHTVHAFCTHNAHCYLTVQLVVNIWNFLARGCSKFKYNVQFLKLAQLC